MIRTGSRHAPGQVLIVTILAMTLLVGLIFFVYNTGTAVNEKIVTQNAADSAAISGAAWMARGMNVVAMNNVAQSRMVALAPVLDALPRASKMAHEETDAWARRLSEQLAMINTLPDDWGARGMIQFGLQSLEERMVEQRDILAPVADRMNNGIDMRTITHWSLDGGRGGPDGALWRAATTLEEYSTAAALSAGVLAQANARRFGEGNPVDTAFLAPILPRMPARRGDFQDFRWVIEGREHVQNDHVDVRMTGGNGGAIPDCAYPLRLGPWARLFRWRHYTRRAIEWRWVPPTAGPNVRGGSGNVSVGGRRRGGSARQSSGGHDGRWVATKWEPTGYLTYGPHYWALRRIHWFVHGHSNEEHPGNLPDTYFYKYMNDLARIKRDYMWRSKQVKTYHYPQWVINYPQARMIAQNPDVQIGKTMFYLVEIASSVPPGPDWLRPGTFRTNGDEPIAVWVDGWADPEEWGIAQHGLYAWKDQYTYETTYDREIGIEPLPVNPLDPNGDLQYQTVYMVAYWIWGGIDIGPEVEVRDPSNYSDTGNLPAPLLLDTSAGDYDPDNLNPDEGFRREAFTFLGVARKGNRSPAWPQRFSSGSPIDSLVAVSQAKLFNKQSWDLWTQHWEVQLAPVSQWQDWTDRLEAGLADVPLTNGQVDPDEVVHMLEYLRRMAPEMVEQHKAN